MNLKITNKYYFKIVLGDKDSYYIAYTCLKKMGCLLGENSIEKLTEFYQMQSFKNDYIIALSPSDNDYILEFELYTISEHSISILKMFILSYIENNIKKKNIKLKKIYIFNPNVFGRTNLYEKTKKNSKYFLGKHYIPLLIIFSIFIISGFTLNYFKFMNMKLLEIIFSSLIGVSISIYYAIRQDTL